MRYEKKLILLNPREQSYFIKALRLVFKQNLLMPFPSRKVHSIYFDYQDRDLYANINGDYYRSKHRIRWYNISNRFKLESKIKNGQLGKKEFCEGVFSESFGFINSSLQLERAYFDIIGNETVFRKLQNKQIVSYNSYNRSYYYIPNLDLRITIDDELKYFNYRRKLMVPIYNNAFSIVEFKFDETNEFAMHATKNLVNTCNLNFSRFSKFVVSAGVNEYYKDSI